VRERKEVSIIMILNSDEWISTLDGETREYRKRVGKATILVRLEDVYKDPTSHLPSLLVRGDWRVEEIDMKPVPLVEPTDITALKKVDNLICRQIAIHERRELRKASKGGEIIRRKGRQAQMPWR